MKAQFFLPSVDGNLIEGKPPISVKFEIPYFTTSGIQVTFPWFELKRQIIASFQKCEVRYLKIIEKSGYQALPWVRYITQNGDYQLRTQWASCEIVTSVFYIVLNASYYKSEQCHVCTMENVHFTYYMTIMLYSEVCGNEFFVKIYLNLVIIFVFIRNFMIIKILKFSGF